MSAAPPRARVDVAWASAPNAASPAWTPLGDVVRSIRTRRGRARESGRFSPGRATVKVKNTNRDFDPMHAGSAYYPNVKPMKKLRVRVGYASAIDELAASAFWRLAESSGTVADDAIGTADGTYTGGPTLGATGLLTGNTAVTFDGVDDYVALPALNRFSAGDCTYVGWIKSTSATVALFSESNTGSTANFTLLRILTNKAQILISNSVGTQWTVTGTTTINDGAWHQLALVRSGNTVTLYVDGATQGTPATVSGTFTFNAATIGALRRTTNSVFLNGSADEVAVFGSALTAAQIAELYQEGINGFADKTLYVGFIEGYPQAYIQNAISWVDLPCIDALAAAAQDDLPASPWDLEVMADGPRAWWKLGEAAGSTSAADSSGNSYDGVARGVTFGATSLVNGSTITAATFDGTDDRIELADVVLPTTSWTVEGWVNLQEKGSVNARPTIFYASNGTDYVSFYYDEGGLQLVCQIVVGATNTIAIFGVASLIGAIHHVAVAFDDDANVIRCYLDGASLGTSSHTVASPAVTFGYIGTATQDTSLFPSTFAKGVIGQVVVYDGVLSATRIAAHYNAGKAGATGAWGGDTTGARIARMADYVGIPAADRAIDTGNSTCQGGALSGTPLSHMQTVESTENGRLFASADGKLTFHERHKGLKPPYTTAVATFGDDGSELRYVDIVPNTDVELVVNEVRRGAAGLPTQVAIDETSKGDYWRRVDERTDLLTQTTNELRDAAYWTLAHQKDATQRVEAIVINPNADVVNLYPQVITREIGERIAIKRRPQSVGSVMSFENVIEGIDHDITVGKSWTTVWALSPAETQAYLILDNATVGKLDTGRLAY